ncbi:MAG: extracellular solute-binding protein [Verrucomicrobia bacterium]|nr:extracellular solute-binding protein [Verrucomicrobiota bacterium]
MQRIVKPTAGVCTVQRRAAGTADDRLCPRQSLVQRHVLKGIRTGRYTERLPGIIKMGRYLGVNTRTVQKALATLTAQGVLYQLSRSGTYVRAATKKRNGNIPVQWTQTLNVGVSETFRVIPEFCRALDKVLGSKRTKVNLVPLGHSFDDYVAAVKCGRQLGPFLDLLMISPLWLDAVRDHLEPLENLAPEWTATIRAPLVPVATEAFRRKGKLLGLPLLFSPSLWQVNEEQCVKAGLKPPTHDWNWGDFARTCEGLTRASGGFGANLGNAVDIWSPFVVQNGGTLFDRETGRCRLTAAPAIEALDFILGLIHRRKAALGSSPAHVSPQELFERGVLGMGNVNYYPRCTPNAAFRCSRVVSPAGKRKATFFHATGLGILKGSRAPEQALDLIASLVGEAAQAEFAVARCALPARQDVLRHIRLAALPAEETEEIARACAQAYFESMGTDLALLRTVVRELDLLWMGVSDLKTFAARIESHQSRQQMEKSGPDK